MVVFLLPLILARISLVFFLIAPIFHVGIRWKYLDIEQPLIRVGVESDFDE